MLTVEDAPVRAGVTRVKSAAVLLLLLAVVAGCGGALKAHESVGVFMTRILREEINGQWSKQWTELHPAHQKLITQMQYVACSRQMGTNIATGKETFHVLAVQDEAIHVEGIPQKTAKLVTISFTSPGATTLTYRLHAVDLSGRWVWILGERFLSEVDKGRCLDGSPLRG
ncbi:MAG TPA: hypothetical protein VFM96_14260 [Gaiellaceae bacterium]|nr:hypothetical protein [Gaiellaceae bacterium]